MDAAEQAMGTGHVGILPVIGQRGILHTETENGREGGGRGEVGQREVRLTRSWSCDGF